MSAPGVVHIFTFARTVVPVAHDLRLSLPDVEVDVDGAVFTARSHSPHCGWMASCSGRLERREIPSGPGEHPQDGDRGTARSGTVSGRPIRGAAGCCRAVGPASFPRAGGRGPDPGARRPLRLDIQPSAWGSHPTRP